MQKPSPSVPSFGENQEQNLDRRELLKVLTASGVGLAAALILPGEWLKPVMEVGVLPAHAQSTLTLRITDIHIVRFSPVLNVYYGAVYYHDDLNKVGIELTSLSITTTPGPIQNVVISPPTSSEDGSIGYTFSAAIGDTSVEYILHVGSRQSAPYSCSLPT